MELKTMRDVGLHVRNLRQQQGLTQAQLAERLNVTRAWVIRLEQGAPRLEAQRVLDALVALGTPLTAAPHRQEPVDDQEDPFADVFRGVSR